MKLDFKITPPNYVIRRNAGKYSLADLDDDDFVEYLEFVKLLFEMREDAKKDVKKAKEMNQRAWLYRSQGWVSCLDEIIPLYAKYHKDELGGAE